MNGYVEEEEDWEQQAASTIEDNYQLYIFTCSSALWINIISYSLLFLITPLSLMVPSIATVIGIMIVTVLGGMDPIHIIHQSGDRNSHSE